MVRLQQAILVWPELVQLRLEQLLFMIGNRFLIQYQDIRDIVIVDLWVRSAKSTHRVQGPYLVLQIF